VEQVHQAFIGRLSALKNPLQAEARESTVFRRLEVPAQAPLQFRSTPLDLSPDVT